jgi:hypothetical protein
LGGGWIDAVNINKYMMDCREDVFGAIQPIASLNPAERL